MDYQLMEKQFKVVAGDLRSMTSAQIRNNVKEVFSATKTLFDSADSEKRNLSKEESSALDESEKYLDAAELELDRRPSEKSRSIFGSLAAGGNFNSPVDAVHEGRAFGKVKPKFDELFPAESIKYRTEMSGDSFIRAITDKVYDTRTMVLGIGESGGFAAPTSMERSVFNTVQNLSFVFSRCSMFPMDTHSLIIPAWKSENQANGHWAGVERQRLYENQTATEVTPKLREMTLSAIMDYFYWSLTRKLIMDSPNLVDASTSGVAYAIAENYDEEILVGGGAPGPLGVLNAPATVEVARATAGTIDFPDIVGLRGRIHPAFASSAVYVASTDALSTLLLLKDDSGSYIFPSSIRGADAPVPEFMLGRPIFFTDKVPVMGSRGDLSLINFSAVALGLRQGLFFENSTSAQWFQNLVSYRAGVHWTAQPLLDVAITPRNGGAPLSHAATLD